jgi:hypothetical protein
MTNYKKYFGTERKVADLMMECGPLAEMFSDKICRRETMETDCLKEDGEYNCRDRKFQQCIMRWLKSKTD